MTKPNILWIVSSEEGLSLGFNTVEEADRFLRVQASNTSWLAQWNLHYLDNGKVEAVCTKRVVLHL